MDEQEKLLDDLQRKWSPLSMTEADLKKLEVIRTVLGYEARMISSSKSGYHHAHPKHILVFNANLCIKARKLWFGDIDLTIDRKKLQSICDVFAETLYVLSEMDARFDNEQKPLLNHAIEVFEPT